MTRFIVLAFLLFSSVCGAQVYVDSAFVAQGQVKDTVSFVTELIGVDTYHQGSYIDTPTVQDEITWQLWDGLAGTVSEPQTYVIYAGSVVPGGLMYWQWESPIPYMWTVHMPWQVIIYQHKVHARGTRLYFDFSQWLYQSVVYDSTFTVGPLVR